VAPKANTMLVLEDGNTSSPSTEINSIYNEAKLPSTHTTEINNGYHIGVSDFSTFFSLISLIASSSDPLFGVPMSTTPSYFAAGPLYSSSPGNAQAYSSSCRRKSRTLESSRSSKKLRQRLSAQSFVLIQLCRVCEVRKKTASLQLQCLGRRITRFATPGAQRRGCARADLAFPVVAESDFA